MPLSAVAVQRAAAVASASVPGSGGNAPWDSRSVCDALTWGQGGMAALKPPGSLGPAAFLKSCVLSHAHPRRGVSNGSSSSSGGTRP